MLSERHAAVRLLKVLIVASVVLPMALFIITAWIDYQNFERLTNERIDASLDILHEQSLKVLQTIERAYAEVNEVLRGMSDDDIRANAAALDRRLRRIATDAPWMKDILVIDRNGRLLVSSDSLSAPKQTDFSKADYFAAVKGGEIGTYVSAINAPGPGDQEHFIAFSQRRLAADGSFDGAISIAVPTSYFEKFYGSISSPVGYFALVRTDGRFLARYPVVVSTSLVNFDGNKEFHPRLTQERDDTVHTVESPYDHITRLIGYRKVAGFPLYVLAGVEWKTIVSEWLRYNINYLIFAAPLTAFLLAGLGLALRRTRRLYDESERREAAEGALRQAQRMEAIGQLTGGVAHDFNNLLMIISGSVQRLRGELTDKKSLRLLDMIGAATHRGETLTRHLLTYSRRQTLTPEVVDLAERLPVLRELLTRSLRSDIEIKVEVPDVVCAVRIDPSEFELAILNLAVNAKDAMPNGGMLSLRAEPVTLKGGADEEGLRGDFIAVRVCDTGQGIPADVMTRVFEPFFTTKEASKGTGLGLSQVYGFAKQSGGAATVTSSIGRGTTVTLYLPRSSEAPQSAAPPPQVPVQAQIIGTVLLVEDNPEVAEVGAYYMRQLGYRVRSAGNVEAALAALRLDPDVDLVFSDIMMPGGRYGLDLACEIGERYPQIPVLLTTGYSANAQDAVRHGVVVLQKPYDLAALRRHVGEAIERAKTQR